VTATHSFFLGNSAGDSGGAVARSNARLSIFDSSFLLNQATTAGGGIYVAADDSGDPARVWVQSTTFDGNLISTAGSKPGGGIANGYSGSFFPNGGVLLLESVTLISNTNGLFNAAGDVHTLLHNTVLTQGPYLNCDGAGTPVTSNGFNFSSDTSCALGGSGDQQGSGLDPKLGPSQCDIRQCYHLPLAGSPLINSGSGCPLRDQRGASRIGACDKGAVEFGGLWRRLWLPLIKR
jgi:predicted outer membrane repeat protein